MATPVAALIVRVAADVADLKGAATEVTGIAKGMAGALAGAFAALDLSGAVDETIRAASAIKDGADKLGTSTETFQRLKFAVDQTGSSMSALETSFAQMSTKLGGKGAGELLAGIGIAIEDLRGKKPEQVFIAIADAVGRIEDPIKRAEAARAIFGRGALDMMPAMIEGFGKLGAQAPIMRDSVVQAYEAMGDTQNTLKVQMQNLQAEALQPLIQAFMALPKEVQTAGAAISTFMPSLESLALSIIALGGPGKAIAMLTAGIASVGTFIVGLQGTIMVWLAGAGTGLVTFFTTTLPAAFTTVIAFLGPQGLIALAVLALGAIWYMWGDQISAVVKRVYTAVKEWLADKLGAIWDSLKQKIEAVKGYFADLYEAVVGSSYVPDMVKGIGKAIDQLDQVFVNPSQVATSLVRVAFETLGQVVEHVFTTILKSATESLGRLATEVIPSFRREAETSMASTGQTMKGALLGGLGAGLEAAAAAIANRAVDAIANVFTGGEEAKVVNPIRDAFFAMFGGYEGLATALTAASDGNIAEQLIAVLFNADTEKAFNAAKEAIETVLAGSVAGMGAGTSPAQEAMDGLAASVITVEESLRRSEEAATSWQSTFKSGLLSIAETIADPLLGQLELLAMALAALPREIRIGVSLPDPSTLIPAPAGLPSFAFGSGGLRDFGSGTTVRLHGREEVRTEAQARGDDGLLAEFQGLRRDIVRALREGPVAARDAAQIAAGRRI